MILGSEAIVWQDGVPDADTTVLTLSPTSDEPVWLAYWDGEIWRDIEGFPRDVVAWAVPPAGLPNPALLAPARPTPSLEPVTVLEAVLRANPLSMPRRELPAARAPAALPGHCWACHGSGEGKGMEGRGPDTYEVDIQCPECNGTGAGPAKLWLWQNFVDGRPEYWAFDNPFPVHMESDDPQTLGEPCGYAIVKPSRPGRTDVSEAEVLRRIKAAKEERHG